MNAFDIIFRQSFSYFGLQISNMIRRLFSNLIDYQSIPIADINRIQSTGASSSFRHTQLDSLNWLYSVAPCFPIDASKVKIILQPNEFYRTLLENCSLAKTRIVLASLYLGQGTLEKALIDAMRQNLKQNTDLKINILLDFTRGTRGKINSKTMLMPLVQQSEQVSVSLYHTPALRGLIKKLMPPRWNEVFGLQHMKIYLFDHTVIISGANLSNDYFTNRQDRYVMIEDQRLANFFADLVRNVQEFSLQVQDNSEVDLHSKWTLSPYKGTRTDFVKEAQQRICHFYSSVVEDQNNIADQKADTWIFPLIEMGQLGIHHDSLVTGNILSNSLKGSRLKIATGYFNLTNEYMSTIVDNCLANCSILMAHPNANGFQGAKGPAGGIPAAYSLIARKFYEKIISAKQEFRINLFEYQKTGWSYHAKGLWYYLPECSLPNLTLIGSSNFGERSVNRDLETQICLVTVNKTLQKDLQLECQHLFELGCTAEKELTNRPIPKWVRMVVSLFRNYF